MFALHGTFISLEKIIWKYLFLDVEEPEPRTCVTIDEWIDVWGTIVGKAKNMDDLPMWLQYYPRTLFDVINRTGKLLTYSFNIKEMLVIKKQGRWW